MKRLAWVLFVLLAACGGDAGGGDAGADPWELAREAFDRPSVPWNPQTYACARLEGALELDGRLDEEAWASAPWTRAFLDIQGEALPKPRFETRVKMLWDDEHFYIAADMEEPHLQAALTKRDAIIFYDNDFEVFLDPDADTHDYFELEINAFGTEWDLYLERPYRDGVEADHDWNMAGLRSAVSLDGTLNDPSDEDRGWSLEIAIPFAALAENAGMPCPPDPGDQWRVNFSRVEWRWNVEDGTYVKVEDPATGEPLPEDNWVWSEQGLVNMHYPEMWGVVEFRGAGAADDPVRITEADLARDRLRQLYYLQRGWKASQKRMVVDRLEAERGVELSDAEREEVQGQYFVSGTNPGWHEGGEPGAFRRAWGFEGTPHAYVTWIRLEDGRTMALREDGRVGYFDPPERSSPMAGLDWLIFFTVFAVLVAGVLITKKYMRSVADFLAAGRTGGRYLVSVSQGMAALGAITIVANLEMNFEAGFTMAWWGLSMGLVVTILAVSGWVTYRFRATRSLTLAEFFERRYSRRFRIFAGLIAFAAGLINFGIFPAVGAKFFIHFTGLPDTFWVLGLPMATYPFVMASLLLTALYFVFAGGQVAVMITDFVQGLFSNVVFLIIPVYLLFVVDWSNVVEVLSSRPEGKSLIDPFDTGYVDTFNFWYFLIGIIGVIYGALSWQGTQGYNTSAKSAHEAKMGGVLSMWRGIPQGLLMLLVPVLIVTVMSHADFGDTAGAVMDDLVGVDGEEIRNQVRTPLVLTHLLPVGLIGMFSAMMLAAFISTHDTYLHSWGSIFIQDVIMPFRKKPYTPREHIRVLRWSIFGVAVFIFLFSLLYRQSEQILLFFAITGAIFAGGSGAVIIGGLYWKRGTTAAAWTAMITGSSIAVGGLILRDFDPDFPVNGQEFWAIAMVASTFLYILVSLTWKPKAYDLDKLLHRGKYEIKTEHVVVEAQPSRGWRMFGMGSEFATRDRVLYILTYVWTGLWTVTFIFGTVFCLTHDVGTEPWLSYWRVFIWVQIIMSAVVIVWFAIGGIKDVRKMTHQLATMERDDTDDGMVRREDDA